MALTNVNWVQNSNQGTGSTQTQQKVTKSVTVDCERCGSEDVITNEDVGYPLRGKYGCKKCGLIWGSPDEQDD